MTAVPARRDASTKEWYDALAADQLLLRSCCAGHANRPDVLACDVCGEDDLTWIEADGRATVVSTATDHAAGTTLVVAELVEGPWLLTRLEGRAVTPGGAVTVSIVRSGEGEAIPIVVAT